MARPAWTEIDSTDIDLDSPGKEDTVFKALRNNIMCSRIAIFGIDADVQSSDEAVSQVDVTGGGFTLYIPNLTDYVTITRKIDLVVKSQVASGVTGFLRIFNDTASDAGSTVSVTSTSYVDVTMSYDITDGMLGSWIDFKAQYRRSAGSGLVYVQAVNSFTGILEY